MPFTLSHAAAALPFLRTPMPAAAIVIGTMAPDLLYFVPVPVERDFTHSIPGAFVLDLPLALLATLIWWGLLRRPIVDLSPAFLRRHFGATAWFGPPRTRRTAGWTVLGATVGIFTHLALDAPTHSGWLASAIPALEMRVGTMPVYGTLHYAGSVAGVVVLAMWWRGRRRSDAPASTPTDLDDNWRRLAWWVVLGTFATAIVVTWIAGVATGGHPLDQPVLFRVARVSIGSTGFVALLCCAAWWWRRRRASSIPAG